MKITSLIVYVSFILVGVAILAFGLLSNTENKFRFISFGGLWLILSILGTFLGTRFEKFSDKIKQ